MQALLQKLLSKHLGTRNRIKFYGLVFEKEYFQLYTHSHDVCQRIGFAFDAAEQGGFHIVVRPFLIEKKFLTVTSKQPFKSGRNAGSSAKAHLSSKTQIISASGKSLDCNRCSLCNRASITYLAKNCKRLGQDSLILKDIPT